MTKWTPARIRALKGKDPFATVTVFDYTSARFADQADFPYLLVGDSLGMTVLGHSSTLPVTMDIMVHHTSAVMRGVKNAIVVADLPFMSYQVTHDLALQNAGRLLQEAGADAVKLEGGAERGQLISRIVQNGIPVTGHIGLTPQSVKTMGYQVQGKSSKQAERLKADALALQDAGVFSLVIEACPTDLAAEITASLEIPTIGIGAGPHCDAQILVYHDLLGLFPDMKPKFVKQYAQLGEQTTQALKAYQEDVKTRRFPAAENSYT